LNICPGSRAGGNDTRTVEVFWGARNFEIETEGRHWRALHEMGATLHFYRDDSGFVLITIYPAYTENRKPIETSITLYIWLDPIKLNNRSFLKKCWNDFMAYMECTSLDGNPTIYQRLRISYLRHFKHLVIENNWMPTKISKFLKDILKFVLSIGLSGFILFLITLFIEPSSKATEDQIKVTNNKLDSISNILDNLNNEQALKDIILITDSINVKVKNISHELKNFKIDQSK
jgi:hypothetical protein